MRSSLGLRVRRVWSGVMLSLKHVLLAGFWYLLEQGLFWLAEPARLHQFLAA